MCLQGLRWPVPTSFRNRWWRGRRSKRSRSFKERETAWDRKIENAAIFSATGATYHLWYTGYNDDRSPDRLLGHATSPDGLRWTRDPANPIVRGVWTEDVWVLQRDGRYQMFAEGRNDIAHQLTSNDGVHWEDGGPLDIRHCDGTPIEPGPYGTPTGWFEDGVWSLFYERGDQAVWLVVLKRSEGLDERARCAAVLGADRRLTTARRSP